MHIRPKTKRRLLVLFGVILLAVGAVVWAALATRHRDAVANKTLRAQAMAAYHAGDYANAVTLLQDYRDKTAGQDADVEVEFAFGQTCASFVQLPARQHD